LIFKLARQHKSILFLFINGPHHVYHLVIPALRFAALNNKIETIFISGNPVNTQIINDTKAITGINNFTLVDIPLPLRYRLKNYKNRLYPPVYTRIKKIIKYLENANAIISTSHNFPDYLSRYKIKVPTLFYLYHGTGTREYGFETSLEKFDHILIPGKYHRDRLKESLSLKDDQIEMIGKPKLDYLKIKLSKNKKLFNNENPIFYYNPHWEIELSSYLKWKEIILQFFIKNKNYNLIFSPHPLVGHLSTKRGYEINEKDIAEDNILVDMGSNQCLDGTYTSIADIYIGDISSMVTEWVVQKPRPCIFINAHNVNWKNNDNYYMWKFGKVVNELKEFEEAITESISYNQYNEIQKILKSEFIYTTEKSSSDMFADFITKKVC
tara:strand:+ start:2669 stop:3814 length:1146 start_codon:yes stop_codon:yes gene_type:complete